MHYSSWTLISRITGQVRTTLLAALWGTSVYGDIFFLAFKIPNLLRRFFAEGAMSSAFVPLFSKMPFRESDLQEEKNTPNLDKDLFKEEFYFIIFWLWGGIMMVVVLLGIAFSTPLASFLYILEEDIHRVKETSLLLKLLFPYIGFISLCSLQQAVLENHGRFALSASVPVLFNLIVITFAGMVILDGGGRVVSVLEIMGFAISERVDSQEWAQTLVVSLGVILGGVGQVGYSFLGAWRLGYRIGSSLFSRGIRGCRHPSVKKFFFLLLPVFFSSGSYQVQTFLIQPIVLSLGEGSVSILYFANRLLEFPLGIVGVAISTAALPLLSRSVQTQNDNKEGFIILIHYALNTVFILFFPILIVSCFYPQTIISLVFEFNRFTHQDTFHTAITFLALVPSLFALAGYRILFNVFYALENTRTPLLISLINLFLGVPLAYLFTLYYPHPAMVAFSSTVVAYLMLGSALYLLRRKEGIDLFPFLIEKFFFSLKLTVLVMPAVYIVYRLSDPIFRVLEKTADNILAEKVVYLIELSFFSLWVFALTLGGLIIFREPQVINFLNKLKISLKK